MNQRKYAKVGGASHRKTGQKALRRRKPAAGGRKCNPLEDAGNQRKNGSARVGADGLKGNGLAGGSARAGAAVGPLNREMASWEEWASEPLEGYDEDLKPDRDRTFSRQTVYLVHKWLAEGMPLPMVARMLNRSEENVRAAAEVPLFKGEKALMERYFCPFRMRKETE